MRKPKNWPVQVTSRNGVVIENEFSPLRGGTSRKEFEWFATLSPKVRAKLMELPLNFILEYVSQKPLPFPKEAIRRVVKVPANTSLWRVVTDSKRVDCGDEQLLADEFFECGTEEVEIIYLKFPQFVSDSKIASELAKYGLKFAHPVVHIIDNLAHPEFEVEHRNITRWKKPHSGRYCKSIFFGESNGRVFSHYFGSITDWWFACQRIPSL